MPCRRLDGTAAAAAVRAELAPQVAAFAVRQGRPPSLAIVLVGDDPASAVYVRGKERTGGETGLRVTVKRLPVDTPLTDVLRLVRGFNDDDECDGILVQSPLPAAMGADAEVQVVEAVDPAKDVDGLHPCNVGLVVEGRPRLAPCTPSGVIELLDREQIPIAGRHAVVIGRSGIVGKPMSLLLLQRDATVSICHSKTVNLAAITSQADILVSAVGRPGFVKPGMVKRGAAVVDVGTTPISDRELALRLFGEGSPRLATLAAKGSIVVGDVHPSVADVAGALSPVPGGVGPLTIAMLLKNTLTAAEGREKSTSGVY
jgi:methylenetetrahydrofolate dehydrogenase (NADP+)/methenyltetrahydrofolate cyclohydrolase